MRRAGFLLLAISSAALAKPHASLSRYEVSPETEKTPAYRYGKMSQDECEAELTARKITFTREEARGVRAPVRVTGTIHGVAFHTDVPEAKRATSAWELADCRLVLALDDFAAILAAHDVVEVFHYSMYRPPSKGWPEGKIAAQHNGALAIDAARFIKSDGKFLDVLKHFHGAIGARTCGDGAGPHPATPEAKELREILCDAVGQHLFNVVLTPNYNRPHRNHFHLEVTAGVAWFLVH